MATRGLGVIGRKKIPTIRPWSKTEHKIAISHGEQHNINNLANFGNITQEKGLTLVIVIKKIS